MRIIFKKRRLAVGGINRAPVVIYPLLTVVDPDIFDGNLPVLAGKRNNKCIPPVLGIDVAPVPVRLLDKMFVPFQADGFKTLYYSKISNTGEIVRFDDGLQ